MSFKRASEIKDENRPKFLIYALPGFGKSELLFTFPDIALIETEDRWRHWRDRGLDFMVEYAPALDEVKTALTDIKSVVCATVGYDSVSFTYNQLTERFTTKTDKGKLVTDFAMVNKAMLYVKNGLFSITGKYIFVTAHLVDSLERAGNEFKKVGVKARFDKSFEYGFDYILRGEGKWEEGTHRVIFEKSMSPYIQRGDVLERPTFARLMAKIRGPKKPNEEQFARVDAAVKQVQSEHNGKTGDIIRETLSVLNITRAENGFPNILRSTDLFASEVDAFVTTMQEKSKKGVVPA